MPDERTPTEVEFTRAAARTTDYCVLCGESPESGAHDFDHQWQRRAEAPDADEVDAARLDLLNNGRSIADGVPQIDVIRVNRLEDAVRAHERGRLLIPSDELVEAVAMAMVALSPQRQWRTDRSWDAAGDSVRGSYRVLARAALQAAAKALDSGSAGLERSFLHSLAR